LAETGHVGVEFTLDHRALIGRRRDDRERWLASSRRWSSALPIRQR
jgi:hypothetical protein